MAGILISNADRKASSSMLQQITLTEEPSTIDALKTALPQIECIEPTSTSFASVSATFIRSHPPLAILRPSSSADVAAMVKYLTKHSLPFTVRSGGHDLWGRCSKPDTIQVNLRHLNRTSIAADRKTCRVGGGSSMADRTTALGKERLVSPFGTIPNVGMGWSEIGGYGLMSSTYGLGCDQIVGAKVIDWRGEEIEVREGL